jgi:hypothetical protein
VEEERRFGLVDERRDVPDIDGLVQINEFARLPQAVEKLAEILLHLRVSRGLGVSRRPD